MYEGQQGGAHAGGAPPLGGGAPVGGVPQGAYGGGGYGGGYHGGMPMGTMGMRRRSYPIETKPFFVTSEFAAALITVIALAITALSSESIDARMFWILTTVLVSFYMLSRGIAKSGTRSMASDPREELDLTRGGGTAGGR